MKIRLPLVLAAGLLTSCVQPAPSLTESSVGDEERMDVVIELTTEGLIYNGEHLKLGTPMSEWVDVLGPGRDSTRGGNLVWDELGLRAHTKSFQDDRVNHAAIVLRRLPGSGTSQLSTPGTNGQPLKLYSGSLIFKGISFDKDTIIRDLSGELYREGLTIGCTKGTGSCTVSALTQPKAAPTYIGFYADSRIYSSPIYIADVGLRLATNPDD